MLIFVGCSSREDIAEKYLKDCEELLDNILRDNDLIFGAYNKGLMGASYKIAKKYNRKITGVCSKFYIDSLKDLKCDDEIVTEKIIDSTMKIVEKADAMIMLPGGLGTVYEFFTSIYSKVCCEHNKPIILYNSNGFFDELVSFLKKIYQENFASNDLQSLYKIANSKEEVINFLSKKC